MDGKFLRCSHCRGFYDAQQDHCRYCGKNIPIKGADSRPRPFPDRATCRAIQIAEFEQLPAQAHDDPFQPAPEILDRLCRCLHCGPAGVEFEAVEMRWMPNESMWACPCTTCGGRGFGFDIHLVEPLWQCAECRYWYAAQNGDRRASNAKCPRCGSTIANGWFEDADADEEDIAEEQIAMEELSLDNGIIPEGVELGEELPFQESDGESWKLGQPAEWRPDTDAMSELPPIGKMPDDIDFPRQFPHKDRVREEDDNADLGSDDIPF